MLKEKKTNEEILHEFYLLAFGREPKATEMKDALEMLEAQRPQSLAGRFRLDVPELERIPV